MKSSTVVTEARRRAGLTQHALAERAGTTQSTIAAYEGGSKEPSAQTMTRIVNSAGFEVAWTLAPRQALTVRTVQEVATLLGEDADKEAFRLVADLAHRLDRMSSDEFSVLARQDPGSTGHQRWDALIAGIVERAAHRHHVRVASWTATPDRFLGQWWFVTSYQSLHASALVETPPELANRGVFLHESSLSRL